ncbi:MAG: IS66 family transposase, partial [Bacteroides sp.]
MERQDFINTINDLRSTIESLRLTVSTLQRTIESLHDGEKRYKKQASAYEEEIAELRQQCEYLESLNKRHCKNRFSGKTLSRKNRTENKKKGRDEKGQDYVDSSSHDDSDVPNQGGAGTASSCGSISSALDQAKVKSEGLNEARGSRGSYEKMDAAETIVLQSTVDGAPAGWKFLRFKDVDEYTKVSYVRKTTFKVAVFVDEYGAYHEYYSPKDPEDERRPYVNVLPGTHCTPDLFSEITSDYIQLHIPIYR